MEALIMIIMQNGFINEESSLCIRGAKKTVSVCTKVLAATRTAGIMTVIVNRRYELPEAIEKRTPIGSKLVFSRRAFSQLKAVLTVLCIFTVLLVCASPALAVKLPKYAAGRKIMHACGSIEGVVYTNSKEALEKVIASGCPGVEIDFNYTKDGILVCDHEWTEFNGKAPTWKRYKKRGTAGGFTAMTAETALKMLIRAKDTYLIVDTKETNVAKVYRDLVKICRKNGGEAYLDKIVAQIYHDYDYKKISKYYSFRNWIFSIYKIDTTNKQEYRAVAKFCKKNGIGTVGMPAGRAKKSYVPGIIHRYGLSLAAYTINKKRDFRRLRKHGVDFIMTDHLW